MAGPKVIRSEINRELTTIACECESRTAKLKKPLITVKYWTELFIWPYGENGKHAGLKYQCRKAFRFEFE